MNLAGSLRCWHAGTHEPCPSQSIAGLEQNIARRWAASPQPRADLRVNMRILTLTGCQYKAIYGTPWRIDPLDNRQFLCSAGHRGPQKTKSVERELSWDRGRGRLGARSEGMWLGPQTVDHQHMPTEMHWVPFTAPHTQNSGLRTLARSASSNAADMNAAQESEDVKVVLGRG